MLQSFSTMETMLQVFWILAIIASVIFVIQAIMTFTGFDADGDADLATAPDAVPEGGDAAFDTDGFHLVSIKSVICFILGFGWTGVLCWDVIPNPLVLCLVSTLVGLIFMASIAFLLYQVLKLNRDNTFRVEQIIGYTAEVYLHIPAQRASSGKVTVSHNGSMHELLAFTDGPAIATGDKVRITAVIDSETVLVTTL